MERTRRSPTHLSYVQLSSRVKILSKKLFNYNSEVKRLKKKLKIAESTISKKDEEIQNLLRARQEKPAIGDALYPHRAFRTRIHSMEEKAKKIEAPDRGFFQCAICLSTVKSSSKKQHLDNHNKDKILNCPIQGCAYSHVKHALMRTHLMKQHYAIGRRRLVPLILRFCFRKTEDEIAEEFNCYIRYIKGKKRSRKARVPLEESD